MVKAARRARGAVTAATSGPADAGCVAPTGPDAVPLLRPGVLGRVARRGVVVLAAGVLVAGDVGTPGQAADRSPWEPAGTSSAMQPVLGGLSARLIETQERAAVSRAESLALADAALRAAAAAQTLSRTAPEAPAADAGLTADGTATDGAGVPTAALTALETAAQEAAAAEALTPLVALPPSSDPDALDEGQWDPDAWSSDATWSDGDETATDDAATDMGEQPVDVPTPADPVLDDGVLDDGVLDDAAIDDPAAGGTGLGGDPSSADPAVDGSAVVDPAAAAAIEPATGEPALPDPVGDGAAESLTTPVEAEGLVVAVERLQALVQAARGLADQPADEVPVVVGTARISSATPVPDAVTPAVAEARAIGGHLALTVALREAAGQVFGLSLRVEGATEAAAEAEIIARSEAVAALEAGAASTLAEADTLPSLTPLTAQERAARAALEARSVAPSAVAGTRPVRVRAGAPPAVAGLAARWDNGRLPVDTMCAVEFEPGHLLQCDAAEALAELNQAYRDEFGTDLALTDSYRTLEGQVAAKAAKGSLAATPGTSNHGWGLAVDIAGIGGLGDFDEPGYLWLKANAEAFGWHHPRGMEPGGSGPQEPWHWEFATE